MANFSDGWDSAARLVDGRWVERRPRRPEVNERLRMETRLMPWLAPQLPLPVPVPHVVSAEPLVVRHALVGGEPVDAPGAGHGRALGRFLRSLHAADPVEAARLEAPDRRRVLGDRAALVADLRSRVLPLLAEDHHGPAEALLAAMDGLPTDTLVHADLGPAHVLGRDGSLTGVIDFSDAHLGDPAIDLSWTLHGTPRAFAEALATAYGVTPALRRRALLWHRIGPWHEVLHGLTTNDPVTVRSGLDGVLARLDGAEVSL